MVLGVLAEHNLPFTMAPALIDTAKELVKDKKVLDDLTMDRTTASYKMQYGLKKTVMEKTLHNIKSSSFSLNIDEATSSGNKKVLAILVSYYSEEDKCVIVEHLQSVELVVVNSESLYNVLVQIFHDHEIPWKNLVSLLMDSCAVMRGNKTGLEKRIRDNKAPHLVDIDGDICHHIHNATKKFCKPFDKFVERLFSDLHNDFKWSPDLKEALREICEMIGLSFTMPDQFIEHRWLSCYDVAVSTLRLIDAYQLFYYGFLPPANKFVYQAVVLQLVRKYGLDTTERDRIKSIQRTLSAKNLTEQGRDRKKRIVEKFFYYSHKTQLTLHLYKSVLPQLKSYVCLFQTKVPLIFKAHDEQEKLFKGFLSCYIKQEFLLNLNAHSLKKFKLDDPSKYLSSRDIFVGSGVAKIAKARGPTDQIVRTFMEATCDAYKACGIYLQLKLPLANPCLQAVSAIDPAGRGHSLTCRLLKKLKSEISACLSEDEEEQYDLQVQNFQTDRMLPAYNDGDRADVWYIDAFMKYPTFGKVVKACL